MPNDSFSGGIIVQAGGQLHLINQQDSMSLRWCHAFHFTLKGRKQLLKYPWKAHMKREREKGNQYLLLPDRNVEQIKNGKRLIID